jgi:toxin ParE1/3/4
VHKYELSRAADKDLTDLYVYTFREFGEAQADAYFASLEESLARLSENPQLGIDVGTLRKGYRRFVHKRHSILL